SPRSDRVDPIPVLQGVLPQILLALIACSIGGVRLLPLAAAGGALVAYGLLKQWPALPHELWTHPNGTEWLLWSLAAAALVATLEHLRLLPPRAAAPIACLVAVAAVHFVLVK